MMIRSNFRTAIAYLQTILLISIVSSGMLFMHKHTTSSGQIVIHVHPYNLESDPNGTKHHHTENEIHFLDVVFSGAYLQTALITYEAEAWGEWLDLKIQQPTLHPYFADHALFYLRGPPQIV
jgi:hypothetical protein